MADATPRTYIYGIILFTLITVAGVGFLSLFGASNPSMLTGKYIVFNESMNKLNDITTQVETLDNGVSNAQTDFGAFGVLNALISTSWNTLKLLGTSLGFMSDAYGAMNTVFGVPVWVTGIITLFVVTMIIFTIYSAIFQTEL